MQQSVGIANIVAPAKGAAQADLFFVQEINKRFVRKRRICVGPSFSPGYVRAGGEVEESGRECARGGVGDPATGKCVTLRSADRLESELGL